MAHPYLKSYLVSHRQHSKIQTSRSFTVAQSTCPVCSPTLAPPGTLYASTPNYSQVPEYTLHTPLSFCTVVRFIQEAA